MRAGAGRRDRLGPTRDVVIIEGPAEAVAIGADVVLEDAHARATGFDPRALAAEHAYLRITPHQIRPGARQTSSRVET